jgi:hypothetical protein
MMPRRYVSSGGVLFAALVLEGLATLHGQVRSRTEGRSLADEPWSGEAVCVLSTRGTNYQEDRTHRWRLTGERPEVKGSVRFWPAVWSVQGAGSKGEERWTIDVPETAAPIAIYEVPGPYGNNSLRIESQHSQLVAREGVRVAPVPGIRRTLFVFTVAELGFPRIIVDSAAKVTVINDSSTRPGPASYAWQPASDAKATETCKWHFTRTDSDLSRTVPPAAPPSPPDRTTTSAAGLTRTASAPATSGAATVGSGLPANSAGSTGTGIANAPLNRGSSAPVNAFPTAITGGGLTAMPVGTTSGTKPANPVDPTGFNARQTGDGTIVLNWNAVPGADSYMVLGPGAAEGTVVKGVSHTVTGVPPGAQTWMVATRYPTDGILTTAETWPRATATVVNSSSGYRILLAGFRVNRETFDDRFFGNGDEVYASAAVTTLDRRTDAIIRPRTLVKSTTYGDTSRNPERVRAGSFSPTGGLRAGDVVPAGGDPRTASGTASATHFPLLVWEGTLRDDIDAVVVNPVLWEMDGNTEYYDEWANSNSFFRLQESRRTAQTAAVKDKANREDLTPFPGSLVITCSSASDLEADCKQPGNDRPIGMNNGACAGDTFTTPNFRHWCELTIVFTREGIERTLSAASAIGSTVGGLITLPLIEPTGVDAIKGGFEGSYEMYLRVERLP